MITIISGDQRAKWEDGHFTAGSDDLIDYLLHYPYPYEEIAITVTGPYAYPGLGDEFEVMAAAIALGMETEGGPDLSVPEGAVDGSNTIEIEKHSGPGDHPSGSPQSVHGGGWGRGAGVDYPYELPFDYALKSWKRVVEDRYGDKKEEVLQQAQAWLDAINIPNRSVFIRLSPSVLEAVLIDGRFKTQFETNYSSGTLAPMIRMRVERTGFGYDFELDPADRPIYGYLNDEDGYIPNTEHNDPGVSLTWYGRAAVKLKDEIKVRTTWTMNDSLADLESGRVAPTLMLQPGLSSIGVDALEMGDYYVRQAEELNHMNRHVEGYKPLSPSDVNGNYIEAQVHGGVSVSDIDYVILPSDDMRIAPALARQGIPVRIHDTMTDEIAPWQAP